MVCLVAVSWAILLGAPVRASFVSPRISLFSATQNPGVDTATLRMVKTRFKDLGGSRKKILILGHHALSFGVLVSQGSLGSRGVSPRILGGGCLGIPGRVSPGDPRGPQGAPCASRTPRPKADVPQRLGPMGLPGAWQECYKMLFSTQKEKHINVDFMAAPWRPEPQ